MTEPLNTMPLGIAGFTYADLYQPSRLRDLHDAFGERVAADDPGLWAQWDAYRRAPETVPSPIERSDLIVRMAPHLSRFVTALFNIGDAVGAVGQATRQLEPRVLASKGEEHRRLIREVRVLDRRIAVVNNAIFTTVLAAVLISLVVILLFVAFLTGTRVGTAIALLFIASMIATGIGFAIFLHETRLGTRTIHVRSHVLEYEPEAEE